MPGYLVRILNVFDSECQGQLRTLTKNCSGKGHAVLLGQTVDMQATPSLAGQVEHGAKDSLLAVLPSGCSLPRACSTMESDVDDASQTHCRKCSTEDPHECDRGDLPNEACDGRAPAAPPQPSHSMYDNAGPPTSAWIPGEEEPFKRSPWDNVNWKMPCKVVCGQVCLIGIYYVFQCCVE